MDYSNLKEDARNDTKRSARNDNLKCINCILAWRQYMHVGLNAKYVYWREGKICPLAGEKIPPAGQQERFALRAASVQNQPLR